MRAITGTIIALDLATATGYAVGRPGAVPEFGTKVLPSTGNDVGRYIAALEDWLTGVIDFYEPVLIVFEAPSVFMKTTPVTIEKLVGLTGETQRICYRRGVPNRSANPSQVKKFWTGKGNAKKPDMEATARRLGFRVDDDNQADALAIWYFAVDCYGSTEARERFQQMQFEASMRGAA